MFENLCYALFIRKYQLQAKSTEKNSQPEELVDKRFDAKHWTLNSYPDVSILSSSERLGYRKDELVLRYHVPNKFKDSELCT